MVCTCSGVCVFLISEIWIRWLTQPTITTVERTDYEVWNIFYPGVSFCSNNKMDTNAWEIFEHKRRKDWLDGKVGVIKSNLEFLTLHWTLFRNKRFALNEMFHLKRFKICYILCIRKPVLFFFVFHFEQL